MGLTRQLLKDKSELDLAVGYRLGKYKLIKQLGVGGSCEVWKARDTVEDIEVALKIPLIGMNGQRNNSQLFREIRLVSQLRHPNILRTKNADIIEGHLVLATEVSLGTLEDRSRPMAPSRFFPLMTQVLEGLAHAHTHKVVHCDVSPMNIFLLPKERAALGDFGISFRIKGRMETIDEFGTPGYVAPEQAYGRPTYSSDCFAVGLIMYEYLTGVLPRWPFLWPFKGHQRLRDKTSLTFVRFIKRALHLDPQKRYAHAGEMLCAFHEVIPQRLRSMARPRSNGARQDWVKQRREAFLRRYGRVLATHYRCLDCKEPIAESMRRCPWCGSHRNHFETTTIRSHVCERCKKGILPEWTYCPWCYGPGYEPSRTTGTPGVHYHNHCSDCGGKVMHFMRYCPWCRRKIKRPWHIHPFYEVCTNCGWSVDSTYWRYCPWCETALL